MIKAVIFDLDGTLADTEPLHKIARDGLLKKLGIFSEELTNNAVGIAKRDFWKKVSIDYSLSVDENELTVSEFKELVDLVKQRKVEPSLGAKELFEYLDKNNIKMAVASSSDEFYVEEVLKLLGIRKYFTAICGGDKVEKAKPFPDVYLKALKLCGVDKSEAIGVDDSTAGMKAVKNAGLICVGCGIYDMEKPQDFSFCDFKVGNLVDVIEVLQNKLI